MNYAQTLPIFYIWLYINIGFVIGFLLTYGTHIKGGLILFEQEFSFWRAISISDDVWYVDDVNNISCAKMLQNKLHEWFFVITNFLLQIMQKWIQFMASKFIVIFARFISRLLHTLSLIHIWRCRRIERCRSRWSPYH